MKLVGLDDLPNAFACYRTDVWLVIDDTGNSRTRDTSPPGDLLKRHLHPGLFGLASDENTVMTWAHSRAVRV